jgi:hypothetical protein
MPTCRRGWPSAETAVASRTRPPGAWTTPRFRGGRPFAVGNLRRLDAANPLPGATAPVVSFHRSAPRRGVRLCFPEADRRGLERARPRTGPFVGVRFRPIYWCAAVSQPNPVRTLRSNVASGNPPRVSTMTSGPRWSTFSFARRAATASAWEQGRAPEHEQRQHPSDRVTR